MKLTFKDAIEFKRATLYPQINVGRFIKVDDVKSVLIETFFLVFREQNKVINYLSILYYCVKLKIRLYYKILLI